MKTIRHLLFGQVCAALATYAPCAWAQSVLLNEIYVNPPGNTLPHEFIELKGPPLQSLDGYFLMAINANAGSAGRADLVLNLNGVQLGSNGLLVVKVSSTNGFLVPTATRVVEDPRLIDTAISPLNNNSVSVLLVQSAVAPSEATDYDANDDGVLDVPPLDQAMVVDAIAIRQLAGDPVYGGARVPNVGNDNRPEAIVRLMGDTRAKTADAWFAGRMNGSGLTVDFNAQVTPNFPAGATLTPGKENLVFTAFRISQSGGTTDVDEDGALDTYTLALGATPANGQVVVTLAADAQLQVSVDGINFAAQTNLIFNVESALIPQTVTVRAVDDAVVETGRSHAGSITHSIAASDDPDTFPTTLPSAKFSANIFDNESSFPVVQPSRETPAAFTPDDSDDAAFWIHPSDPAKNLLLTSKKLGGATVFDLELNVRQAIAPETAGALRLNNVDVLYGFELNGSRVDLAVFSDRINDTLYIYRIDGNASTNPLTLVSADLTTHVFPGSATAGDTAYGLCLYKSLITGKQYAFVSRSGMGHIAQVELFDAGDGRVGWRPVRVLILPETWQAEGIVADPELGWVYFAQEKVGVWKFAAEPTRAAEAGVLIHRVKPTGTLLSSDIEGLCIYDAGGGRGYLIVSSQGDNNFAVFSREAGNGYLGSFAIGANPALGIDQVTTCDGAEVCPIAMPGFPHGVLIVQDGENDGSVFPRNTNFKLVPWEKVAGAFVPALTGTSAGYNPRSPVNRLPARFDSIALDNGGVVHFTLSGAIGGVYRLQTSLNLIEWETIAEITLTSASFQHTQVPEPGAHRFYRLATP